MSSPLNNFDVASFMKQHVSDVFTTMASLEAVPTQESNGVGQEERITGGIGIGGEQIAGAVYLHMPLSLANHITRQMLGMDATETPDECTVNDVVGELTNMLAGGLKSTLCDRGAPCAVSTPAIIRGAAFEIETMPETQQTLVRFRAADFPFLVEVHLKFN